MNDNNDIILNKEKIITTDKIYNKIKEIQTLELVKGALSFLLATLVIRILDNLIFSHFNDNKILQTSILLIILISIVYISITIFTNIKVEQDKNILLKGDM